MNGYGSQFDAGLKAAAPTGEAAFARRADAVRNVSKSKEIDPKLRERVGDFVGNVFYGTLLKELQNSKLKGEYFHGGRGEEVFKGQLYAEYARRLGRAPGDPIANRIYEAMTREANNAKADANETTSKAERPKAA